MRGEKRDEERERERERERDSLSHCRRGLVCLVGRLLMPNH